MSDSPSTDTGGDADMFQTLDLVDVDNVEAVQDADVDRLPREGREGKQRGTDLVQEIAHLGRNVGQRQELYRHLVAARGVPSHPAVMDEGVEQTVSRGAVDAAPLPDLARGEGFRRLQQRLDDGQRLAGRDNGHDLVRVSHRHRTTMFMNRTKTR